MRQVYLKFSIGRTLSGELSWNHYVVLSRIRNEKSIDYYIYLAKTQNLSVRKLRERIKSNEYERIGHKKELEKPKINTLIKNPIIIKPNKTFNNITEKLLHQLIMEDMDNFLKELGIGFMYYGHEVRIKIGTNYHYIDFLLFNYKFNCFVVVEVKITKMKAEYIGQVLKYINYIDKNIKEVFNDKTIGIIIVKRNDKFILEYCSDERVFTTAYKIKEIIL